MLCSSSILNFDYPKPRNLKLAERRVGKSLTLPILSVVLGLLLMLTGFVKLTPQLSAELYREVSRQFVIFAKSPSIFSLLGFHLDADSYRLCVGWLELIGGLMLFSSRGGLQLFTNVLMIVVNLNSIYAHFSATEKFERKYFQSQTSLRPNKIMSTIFHSGP